MTYNQRKVEFLSPTSIKIADGDMEEFAVKYLINNRPPRPPQTVPMAIGSSFDAFAKSYLYYNLFGNYGNGYELQTLFEAQVEAQNRTTAFADGKECFDLYKKCGALDALMAELSQALGAPRFEFKLQGTVDWAGHTVPLLGKPDIYFMNALGARVVYDFKVNGFYSWRNTSPMKGYVACWDNGARYQHKDALISPFKGININCMMHLENGNKEWADQLSVYSWLLGEEVGSEDVVFGIDQITGPRCSRISSHRLKIKPEYRYHLIERIVQIWEIIASGHIFREVSREESDSRLEMLEAMNQRNEVDDILS